MPMVITGRAHSRRRDIFFGRIKQAAEEGADVLVIVPDQYTFAMDRELYDRLGVKLFNSIATDGISALAEKLCREHGGLAGENADEQTRIMAMYRAQSKLAADRNCGVRYYRRSLLKPSFITQSISLLSGLSHSGITPETLRAAADSSKTGAVRLTDLAIVYEAYGRELEAMGLTDVSSLTARAAAIAKEKGCFKGKKVFFDGFNSFSKDELLLVRAAVGTAAETVFSIVCESIPDGIDPFSETRRTISRIETISEEVSRRVDILHADGCSQRAPLGAVNERLFAYAPGKCGSEGLVKVGIASDIYEECDHICAEVVRLARDEGYRLNEMAVICGSLEESSRILAAACDRAGIPYFVDKPKSALNSIPAKYLMSILDAAVTKKYRTDCLLRIIKSPLSIFHYYDACDLEKHCRYWNVEGDMWKQPFIDEDSERSRRIEDNRRIIIEPFERFRAACADGAAVGDMCTALYALLDELKMSEKVYSKVRTASGNDTELEVTRSLKQVWLGLVSSIRSVYEHMKDEKLTLREFAELLKLMLATLSVSSPPQKADCLLIGDADRTRISGVRALFIMQANDGIFPKGISRSELLGDSDIEALEAVDADISLSPRVCLDGERMQTYSAVTAPSERLYVSYSESDRTGAVAAPSQLPAMLRSLFDDDIRVRLSELPPEVCCTSYRTAFYKYLEHKRENTVSAANILASLEGSEEYMARLENADREAEPRAEEISSALAKRLFYRHGFRLSATRVSDYYKCPFSYFCKNGLKLSAPSRVKIDAVNIGRITHRCLERVMSREKDGRRVYDENFPEYTDAELAEKTSAEVDAYIADWFGSRKPDQTFLAAAERLKGSILRILRYLRDEKMDGTGFTPAAFEYDLGGEKDKGCRISGGASDGEDITLYGQADRIDIYRDGERSWLRVVDYKTGSQKFNMDEIYHGLGLQMLIYMSVLEGDLSGLPGEGSVEHAGVMYSHIGGVEPKLDPKTVEKLEESSALGERLDLECARSFKPDGMMLDDEIRGGFNMDNGGVYTIFRYNNPDDEGNIDRAKNSAEPVTAGKLRAMERFAIGKVVQMAKDLEEGRINADPIRFSKDRTSCTNCDFRGICRRPEPKEMRAIMPGDAEKLDEELKKLAEDMKNDT